MAKKVKSLAYSQSQELISTLRYTASRSRRRTFDSESPKSLY